MVTDWTSGPCSPLRWRQLDDGRIEIEGEGVALAKSWPSDIDRWRTQIFAAGARQGVLPNWIAGIMGIETGGKTGLVSYAGAGGLMALMPGTAAAMETKLGLPHRPFAEIVADNELNLELGVAYLRDRLDAYGGQFPMAAIAYNAGSVRCGTGRLCVPPGARDCVKTPCPPNDWGAVMDCWLQKDGSLKTSDYPRRAVQYANSALDHGFGKQGVVVATVAPSAKSMSWPALIALAVGAGGGWLLMKKYGRRLRR